MDNDRPSESPSVPITIEEMVDGFHRMQVEHARVVQHVGVQSGLNPTDVRVLKYLGLTTAGDEAATPKSVGAYLQMSRGAVTALLDRLESRGLLERSGNPKDRRITFLRLTPQGVMIVDRVRDAYARAIEASVRPEWREAFLRGCHSLGRELDAQVSGDIARSAVDAGSA